MRASRNTDVRARRAEREGNWARIEQEALRSGDVVTWLEAKIQQARPSKGGEWPLDSIVTQAGWAAMFGDPVAREAFPQVPRKEPSFPVHGLNAWRGRPRSGGEEIRVPPIPPLRINKYQDSYGWFVLDDAGTTTIWAAERGPFESDEDAQIDAFEQALSGDPYALSALLWVKSDSLDVGEGNPFWYDTHQTGEAVQPRLQPTAYGWICYENALLRRLVKKRSSAFAFGPDIPAPEEAQKADVVVPMRGEALLVQQWFWNRVLQVPAPYSIIEAAKLRQAALPWNPPALPLY